MQDHASNIELKRRRCRLIDLVAGDGGGGGGLLRFAILLRPRLFRLRSLRTNHTNDRSVHAEGWSVVPPTVLYILGRYDATGDWCR
ncbi:hypothetical protein BDV26DRAFT_271350 [Aspergillus bertholletiae]|uniref:Uncharacterized protein n=1 Tax=Aspergillus bertholletiae TaxID=1226010 RepID=A0A5N7AV88_9EURO|nr:hypothetical protein BDV26DRAFT_271350 [Aspergillus bertholletiae]